jgi:DNA-binding CsgD family transcriptional regulator
LARAVKAATDLAAGVVLAPEAVIEVPRYDRLPIALLVAPWRPAWGVAEMGVPASIVFLRDPESLDHSVTQCLKLMFGLTPTEAVIATAVGRGQSPEQISIAGNVSIGTVRTHLKSILAKTGAKRLASLAAMVAGGVIGVEPSRTDP